MSKPTPSHTIVLGCGRSGTSIFGELFQTLPQYTYYCEPPFVDLLSYDDSAPLAVKVPTESPGYPPSPGLSFPINDLDSMVSGPVKIFWMVRHPLDAICSLRVGISKEWSHHPQPPDWRDWRANRSLLECCAHHWSYINSQGFDQVRADAKVMHFEAMIENPVRFATDVCEHVGLDIAACGGPLHEWSRRVQDSNNAAFVEAECSRNFSRPDHSVRIGRWRENLSTEEAETTYESVKEIAEQFGYDLT